MVDVQGKNSRCPSRRARSCRCLHQLSHQMRESRKKQKLKEKENFMMAQMSKTEPTYISSLLLKLQGH